MLAANDGHKISKQCSEHASLQSTTHSFETSADLSKLCTFGAEEFEEVLLNLVRNPNITSSHLFRADILWDSEQDTTFDPEASLNDEDLSGFVKHMRREYRPWKIQLEEFQLRRTLVRQLIPRNPQLDKSLPQTCHFFESMAPGQTAVVYLPHADKADDIPWYHPPLKAIAFLFEEAVDTTSNAIECNKLSLHIAYYPELETSALQRTSRTLQNLLNTTHKHAESRLRGYEKRVHHDLVVPQKAFQDTYVRLKQKYAKVLINSWKEQTDVTKSVFEDLGIAAFLIELWLRMYRSLGEEDSKKGDISKSYFPGFVDMGCGNGLLVFILAAEGYSGYGFDARSRKTWSEFPDHIQARLQEKVLVPWILDEESSSDIEPTRDAKMLSSSFAIHTGRLPRGTFIISNHADELTPWTPLLAYLNESPFIAIPCCSFDLAGNKFRYGNQYAKAEKDTTQKGSNGLGSQNGETKATSDGGVNANLASLHAPKRDPARPPSAYSTLCGYVAHLATEFGFSVQQEMLRIPSTRNACIVAKPKSYSVALVDGDQESVTTETKTTDSQVVDGIDTHRVRAVLERETGLPIGDVSRKFNERAEAVWRSKSRGH